MTHDTNKLLNGATVDNEVLAVELGLEKLVDDQTFSLRLDQNFRVATLDEQVTYPAPAFTATDTPIAPRKAILSSWAGSRARPRQRFTI